MAQALNLNLVNNNNNNNVNHANNNCDCCGIFNNSTNLLAAKIRLATNNDQTPVTLTLEQLRMLQADLARIPQLEHSLQQKEVQLWQKDVQINDMQFANATKDAVIASKDNQILEKTNENDNLNNELNNTQKNLEQDSLLAVAKKSAWDVAYSATFKIQNAFGLVQKDNKK